MKNSTFVCFLLEKWIFIIYNKYDKQSLMWVFGQTFHRGARGDSKEYARGETCRKVVEELLCFFYRGFESHSQTLSAASGMEKTQLEK